MPSLKWYTTVTIASFGALIALASHQSDVLGFKNQNADFSEHPEDADDEFIVDDNSEIHWLAAVISVNMAACILLLFALAVVRVVFGELRTQELNAAKDKFWNFVFYKVKTGVFVLSNMGFLNQKLSFSLKGSIFLDNN